MSGPTVTTALEDDKKGLRFIRTTLRQEREYDYTIETDLETGLSAIYIGKRKIFQEAGQKL